jgi:hypothetical protein
MGLLSAMRHRRVLSAVLSMPLDRLALVLTLGVFTGLAVYRGVHLWLTGFYVSDEFSYVVTAINGTYYLWGHVFLLSRSGLQRPFFLAVNSLILRSAGVRTGSEFAIVLPFYLMLWNSVTILSAYGILKTLGVEPRATAACLVSMIFLPSLLVLCQGFLTEPVSLSMVMLGIYLLVLYAKTEGAVGVVLPLLAMLAFGAAAYTHEPNQIFLYLAWIPVGFISVKRFIRLKGLNILRRLYVGVTPILLLTAASCVLLVYPRNIFQEQTVQASGLVIGVGAGLRAWGVQRMLDTLAIFVGGLLAGWNPILVCVAASGFLLLVKSEIRWRSAVYLMALACGGVSLAQYFFVSAFLTAVAGFTFLGNLSTIIRYSQMAIPAYFLSAPFSFSRIGRRKLGAIFVLLLVLSVGVAGQYQQYLQTHLSYGYPYSNGQPIFTLYYRTPLAQLRDYIAAHPSDNPIIVFAEPNPRSYYDNFTLHWQMIPGTEHLPPIKFYPYLPQSEFLSMKPSRFYIYGEGDGAISRVAEKAPYLLTFIQSTPSKNSATPYEAKRIEVVHQGSDAFVILVELSWNN